MWIYLLIWTSLIYNLNSEHNKKFLYYIRNATTCQLERIEILQHIYYPEKKIMNNGLIKVHNCFRNRIRFINEAFPKGSNLRKMESDDRLSKMAEKYISQCDMKTGCSKNQYTEDTQVERNFKAVVYNKNHEVNDPVLRFANIIKTWAYEIEGLSGSIVKKFQLNTSPEKDWVNLFRATTYKVGCAIKTFPPNKENFIEIYACNYAPANLKEGEEIYKKGNWCTECLAEMECDKPWFRLCAPKIIIDDNNPSEILWRCDFSDYSEQCEYEIQCSKDWERVCKDGSCHQEITTNKPKSSLLFMSPIYVKDHACLEFDFKKYHLPIYQRESLLAAIAVWNNGKNHTALIIDEDVNIWTKHSLQIPVKDETIQVGFSVRNVGNSKGQTISIRDLVVSSGSC